MNLGIFLALGDSFSNLKKSGQDDLFKRFYISCFARNFAKIYIFSYEDEYVRDLPENVVVIPNKFKLNRYLYAFLIPFLNLSVLFTCDVFRAYHLSGTIPAVVTKIFLGKPFIFNFAYDYERFAKIEGKNIQLFLSKLLKPIAIFFAYKIFAANRSILKNTPKIKTVFLPNGVDTDFFKPPKNKKIKKRPLILSVGRLEKQKNFEILIAAMEGLNADLKIVGDGSLRYRLIRLTKNSRVNLDLIRMVPHSRMPRIYQGANLFILPSKLEGSPKVLLEAMACGLPVVATRVEGIIEIIKNKQNGLLISPDKKQLAQSIKKILKNESLSRKLARDARKTVEANFNLNELLKREINTIRKVAI